MASISSVVIRKMLGNVVHLRLDNPPVNSLSSAVVSQLLSHVNDCKGDPSVRGLILTGTNRFFSAGAEIKEFSQMRKSESGAAPSSESGLVAVIQALEDFPAPVVAGINGFALGGGMELTLGCHFRVAAKSCRWGLPEVHLGLLPGAQGTQRLPRLVGAQRGLSIILEGNALAATTGMELGVFDDLADSEEVLMTKCLALIQKHHELPTADKTAALISRKLRLKQVSPIADREVEEILKRLGKARLREAAVHAIVECVKNVHLPFSQGAEVEQQQFRALMKNPQSAALQYMFFAEREAAKIPDVPPSTPSTPINHVSIVGAGLMGTGIASCFAAVNIPVTLVDSNPSALVSSQQTLKSIFAKTPKSLDLISTTVDLNAIAKSDLVIEAVFEDMDLKKQMFKQLDAICKPDAFLCSNTSYLDIDAIAKVTKRPDRVMGLHFFSPANKMPLLEEVRGSHTSATAIQTLMNLAKAIKKTPVLVGNCHGFVGNRLFGKYTQAADELVLRGLTPLQVDEAAESWGMKMGPFAVHDLVGLELRHRQRVKAKQNDPARDFYDAVVESGRLGQKNKQGFYVYDETRRQRQPDLGVESMIRTIATRLQKPQTYSSSTPQDQVVLDLLIPLINEAFYILEEGIALRPSDVDLAMVLGYGFPRWRGGPLWFAEHEIGFPKLLEALDRAGIMPAPLLIQVASSDSSLADFWSSRKPLSAKL